MPQIRRHVFKKGKRKTSVMQAISSVAVTDATRYSPDINVGLTNAEVRSQTGKGLFNGSAGVKTKSEKQIILENTFTFFNTINFIFAILLILVGAYKQTLFMGVIFSNAIIGSFQEIRSKRIIDKLSLVSAPKAAVIRDSVKKVIAVSEVVLDDILHLASGNQICADCTIASGEVEVNESLLTGESDPIIKKIGDSLLSGSFIVSGDCLARVEHIGADNYANRIASGAKYIKKTSSKIVASLNMIVKIIGFSIVPIGIALFTKQYFINGDSLQNSVMSVVAALIGMIPEGLVLLTSVVFAVSIIRLSMRKTLVQELYCIETLARVDVLCLDKTGTITEGTMQTDAFVPFDGHTEDEMSDALCALTTTLTDDNPTFNAIKDKLGTGSDWTATYSVAFSSARKWSGASFMDKGTYIMGAGEFILNKKFVNIKAQVEEYSKNGQRVLLLAKSKNPFNEKELPAEIENIGLVLISDKIREEAPRTLRYFADQGVDIKVISGDNAVTVANIAKKAGLARADDYIDASTLKTADDVKEAIEKYAVFGRVTPQQKLDFVKALKGKGHIVAMTGDGVNDVLALKESDCSIAMASGSDAARTVSNLVLLDSNFASMPLIVQEGRRSINNLQRSASLFLTKTIYSVVMAVLFIFLESSYPFQPIHLTLISTLTIGIPSFILAMEPNKELVRGSFLANVLNKSLPTGVTMVINVILLLLFENRFGLTSAEMSTLAVMITTVTGLILLVKICFPFSIMRTLLVSSVVVAFILSVIFFADLFSLVPLTMPMIFVLIPMIIFSVFSVVTLTHVVENVLPSQDNIFKFNKKK